MSSPTFLRLQGRDGVRGAVMSADPRASGGLNKGAIRMLNGPDGASCIWILSPDSRTRARAEFLGQVSASEKDSGTEVHGERPSVPEHGSATRRRVTVTRGAAERTGQEADAVNRMQPSLSIVMNTAASLVPGNQNPPLFPP